MKTTASLCMTLLALFGFGCAETEHGHDMAGAEVMTGDRLATFDFTKDTAVQTPRGWSASYTGSDGSAVWRVEEDGGGRILKLAEAKSPKTTFNLFVAEPQYAADVVVSAKVRADSGTIDQGGGVIFRAKDGGNYYITRWNPLEKNVRLYRVVNGERKMLESADVDTDAKAWHTTVATAMGNKLTVVFDGSTTLHAEDDTFADGGRVGFWTKADAATSFDDLIVTKAN